jgi:hypothetical protein
MSAHTHTTGVKHVYQDHAAPDIYFTWWAAYVTSANLLTGGKCEITSPFSSSLDSMFSWNLRAINEYASDVS